MKRPIAAARGSQGLSILLRERFPSSSHLPQTQRHEKRLRRYCSKCACLEATPAEGASQTPAEDSWPSCKSPKGKEGVQALKSRLLFLRQWPAQGASQAGQATIGFRHSSFSSATAGAFPAPQLRDTRPQFPSLFLAPQPGSAVCAPLTSTGLAKHCSIPEPFSCSSARMAHLRAPHKHRIRTTLLNMCVCNRWASGDCGTCKLNV